MSASVEIQLIAVVVAAACALPGVFLVLRSMSMMADAISHTVLLGIVLAFFVVADLQSPWLLLGAAAVGVLTVSLVELLNRTQLVKQDAAIGLVFPALFSLAVILISRFARGVHLDVDAVLLGELAFAPFDRIEVMGVDLPHALVTMGIILALNAGLIALFYKELKLSTFDAGLAATLGFAPGLLHYGLMAMVSVTAVGAFDAVGAVLVVALMVTPAAAAYLLTDDLRKMLVLSVLIAVASALGGYWLARPQRQHCGGDGDGNRTHLPGGLSTCPTAGIAAVAARRQRQKLEFAQAMLAIHLLHHEGRPEADAENRAEHLSQHVHWAPAFAEKVVRYAERKGIVNNDGGLLQLTESGRLVAQEAMVR